ncbi:PQQ-binding-like beta-propeller repeat protein [Nocardiopsis sp. NPDC058789]|uniref:outer membrane protein assembly factor BamB family protein n=1 Tax=Nocardiopsis sp. NPDC058789 TaxID=3346634 RepID=UPI00366C1B5D
MTLLLSACTLSSEGSSGENPAPETNADHEVSEGGMAAPEDVTSVSEVGWEWHPGEDESATDVHPGPVGAVVELTDGLIGLRGDTGEELWSYRIPEAGGFSASFSPSGEQVLVTASDEPATLLDTETGATVAEDVDWDGQTLLLDETRLLDYRGEATELLFEVSDLESGETLWQQETPVACPGDTPSRLISALHASEALVLLLHCSEDTSEGALRVPEADTVNALVALDPVDGEELWRQESEDTEGLGLAEALLLQGAVVADLPGEEGWLIIDPADGSVLAESPKPVLSVGEGHYLAGPDPLAEDPTHELRTFDGEVTASATLPDDRWPGDTPESAVGLPEQLVTVDMERGSPEDPVNAVVTPWDDAGSEDVIDATATKRASQDDPGRLLPVPGALLVYVPVDLAADIDSVGHVAALR